MSPTDPPASFDGPHWQAQVRAAMDLMRGHGGAPEALVVPPRHIATVRAWVPAELRLYTFDLSPADTNLLVSLAAAEEMGAKPIDRTPEIAYNED